MWSLLPKEEVELAHTVVRDVVIWTKHVHGGDTAQRLSGLPGDTEVTLVVDGVSGRWCKMRDGRDGRRTAGLRPVGRAQSFWQSLFESRRGESVSIELESSTEVDLALPEAAEADRWSHARRAEEREAARAAIGLAPSLGWSSEGQTLTRDELYDR